MKNKNIILIGSSCVLLILAISIMWFEISILWFLAVPVSFIGLVLSLFSWVLSIINLIRRNNVAWNILFFIIGSLLVAVFSYLFITYWILFGMIG